MEVTCDDNCQCILVFDVGVGHIELGSGLITNSTG
jgi:hypothetical protein